MDIFLDANGKEFILPEDESVYWRISGYALVLKNNKILTVVPTWNTLYELPGGRIKEKEDIKSGIIRECWEETGYKIEILDNNPFYFAEQNFYHRHHKKFYHSLIIVYKANNFSDIQDTSVINTYDGNEISKVEWLELEKFNSKNTHWIIYPAIEKLRNFNS